MLIQMKNGSVWEDICKKENSPGFVQLLLLPQSASKGDVLRILTGGECLIGIYRIIKAVKGKVDSELKASQEKKGEQRDFEGMKGYDMFELEQSRPIYLEITEVKIEMMTSPTIVHIETKQR